MNHTQTLSSGNPLLTVVDLIVQALMGSRWNTHLLQELQPPNLVHTILQTPLGQKDIRCWRDEPAGTYSYRALFKHLQHRIIGPMFPWQQVWKLEVWPKLQLFAWRLLLDKMPTQAHLARWNATISPLCPICCIEDETVEHLLVQCPFAKSLLLSLAISIPRPTTNPLVLAQCISQ